MQDKQYSAKRDLQVLINQKKVKLVLWCGAMADENRIL